MAVTFKFPKSIPWTTSMYEPGTSAGLRARDFVDERFEAVTGLVESSRVEFADAISKMNQSLSPIVVNELDIAGITVPDLGGDIPTFTGTFDKTFTATLEDFDVTYTEPEGKPDPSAFEWEEGIFSLTTELVDKLAHWLLNGESAIPEALFNEMYTVATTQLSEDVTARRLVLLSEAAARGWDCPEEIESAKLLQLEREYGKGAAEVAASIATKNMELVQANFHKAVEVAAQYIQVQMDYNIKKNTAKIGFYVSLMDAWIKQVEASIKVIDAKVAAFNGKVEAFKAKAMVYKTEADVFESSISAYVALVEGLKAKISAVAESVKMQVAVFQVESNAAIEEEKLRVQAQIANQTLAQKIAEAQSNLHAQMVASGLSAMHVQASISASHGTGQQVGFSYSYGEQMSEQHSESQSTSINAEV